MNDREKILEKLQKIKAHAESAEKIGSQAEAEAFAAMFQQLLLKHKISATEVEVEQLERDEPVDKFQVDWQDIRVRSTRIAWIERLAGIVARAYFCRILVHPRSSNITIVGRKSDAAIAEYMLVTLVRAAQKIAAREFGVVYRRNPFEATGFKASFLKSFTIRMAERFEEELRAPEANTNTALVRINRAEAAVNDFMGQFKKKASIVRGARHDANALGWRRGREIANAVNLHGTALEGGNTQNKALRA